MKVNRNIIIVAAILAIVVVFFVVLSLIKGSYEKRLKEEITKRVESEMRLKQLVKDYALLRAERNTAIESRDLTEKNYNNQKQRIKNIIDDNEKMHRNIDSLSADEAYLLYTNNIKQYKFNRERYNLTRFRN